MLNQTLFKILSGLVFLFCATSAQAQNTGIQDLMQVYQAEIAKGSRKSVGPAIVAIRDSKLPQAQQVLEKWQAKELWYRKANKQFFFVTENADQSMTVIDIASGTKVPSVPKNELKQVKPNSGVRGMIGAALVQFQLLDPNPEKRLESLTAIQRDPQLSHLGALRGAIDGETNADIKTAKIRLERLLSVSYATDEALRITAIKSLSGDLGVDARAALNPLLATTITASPGLPDANIAKELVPGSDGYSKTTAYTQLVAQGLAVADISDDDIRKALTANIVDGKVAGARVDTLGSLDTRNRAYAALADAGIVPATTTAEMRAATLAEYRFFEVYHEPSEPITSTAKSTLSTISTKVQMNQFLDLAMDGISLASIYFLAAIGLAITFGVMGVINMAHGEFIMMGAYTGYVVQQFVPDYTLSIIIALPLAFAVTFAAGVAMERLVIRWLYNRPLETLLATFGISIALQQSAKNIFGTQARPLTSPAWLDGAWVLNDVVSISYIRVAIFLLALGFFGLLLFILKRTRLGLEVRAVTQNPRMAASMGINPDRINMLTFGLGSGIAGIAGIAIGLFAKVTSELGSDYIVQSFMTVVVGGVGNIWGTLAGAAMIGFLQKGIEWMNPSNTLAAQTFMIIFIIVFIQFRPRGIIALKGRAAGD